MYIFIYIYLYMCLLFSVSGDQTQGLEGMRQAFHLIKYFKF